MFSKITSLALLSTAALVAAAPANIVERNNPWVWNVTRFTSTCTAATCRYDFNVSAPTPTTSQEGFDAYGCDGKTGHDYEGCTTVGMDVPGNVLARVFNLDFHGDAIVSVQHIFLNPVDNLYYTYIGNSTVPHTNGGEPLNFTILPSIASVVIPDKV